MDPSMINVNLLVKGCKDVTKGLGVFATRRITKGLCLLEESPILSYESRDDAARDIEHDFPTLPPVTQAYFTRLFAGVSDVVPVIRKVAYEHGGLYTNLVLADEYAKAPQRLQDITRYNAIEGQGTGCVLLFSCSFFNHSCVPNAWIYWNTVRQAMTVYALRDIEQGEEITISYLQELTSLNREQRHAHLAN